MQNLMVFAVVGGAAVVALWRLVRALRGRAPACSGCAGAGAAYRAGGVRTAADASGCADCDGCAQAGNCGQAVEGSGRKSGQAGLGKKTPPA